MNFDLQTWDVFLLCVIAAEKFTIHGVLDLPMAEEVHISCFSSESGFSLS